ncbi:BZ3500_MvSof-1268-A1-R1_Chr4-1g06675 [Microbotryum saponariae]|uniref:BZ3500_MvSof-1268-A1-R1_Chr4-1g06675 protein n=1 Tax=Microbotryum saponariae TaxID=289078 RepID=A0A2X0KSA0_9BASI|nr:BZ3500_MvSof-1268-A1-R1_Chr4-1g06675 [Microbotryum saponariae]SDA06340.1 BZ3501_MvSof-1269-A2-R1_Chr4-1g06385 [Microbotryum saponariae]
MLTVSILFSPPVLTGHLYLATVYGSGSGARSPPPLQHPRPKHPPSQIPSTSPPPPDFLPNDSRSYQRFSSPPIHHQLAPPPQQQQGGGGGGGEGGGYYAAGAGASGSSRNIPHQAGGAHYGHPLQQQWSPQQSHAQGYPDAYIPSGHQGPTTSHSAYSAHSQAPSQQQQPPPPFAAAGRAEGGGGGGNWLSGGIGQAAGAVGQGGMPSWPGMNDATTAMGVQFGKHAFDAGQAYLDKNFTRLLPLAHLKHSFNVSNSYVLQKLRLVLWPWRHRPWSRSLKRSESSGVAEGWKPPRDDINCPDLYIPVMSVVTYILLSAIIAGKQGQFDPRIVGQTASKSFGILVLEFICIKLGCYLLGIGEEGTVVDMLSYEGYKFVGVIVTLLAGLVGLKGWSYWGVFGYVFLANFFFQLRSLRHIVLPDPNNMTTPMDFVDQSTSSSNHSMGMGTSTGVSHGQRSRRIQFLFVVAALQGVSMFVLVHF